MINPNKIETCTDFYTISGIENKGTSFESVTLENWRTSFNGYSDNIVVKNKYGYELKNKRLNTNRKYKVFVRYSILAEKYVITELKEV